LLVLPALLVSLSAGAVWLVRRLRRAPEAGASLMAMQPLAPTQAMVCPTCQRQYPPGLRFCPRDARALVGPDDWAVDAAASVTCGACRRSFDPGTRFCPYDAEELTALAVPSAGRTSGRPAPAKICPSCTEHYPSDETICGKDGSELAQVN
jgi:predicted amidophosphoribosyltransferase